VLGVGGIGGYNYWQEYQLNMAAEASSHFEAILEALEANDEDSLQQHADTLIADFASTDYALLARLALARSGAEKGEFEQAEAALQAVVGSAGDSPLSYIARTRLAAVQIQLGRYDQALATLATEFPNAFLASAEGLRGDALSLQGRVVEARDAYIKAQLAEPGPANAGFLKQKLDDLGAPG